MLWFGNFNVIEDGIGLLGMVTLSFVVAAWRLHPDAGPIVRGFIPSVASSRSHPLRVSHRQHRRRHGEPVPAELLFRPARSRRSGRSRICGLTDLTAFLGMGFGSTVAMGCLVTAAIVFGPQHVKVETYEQAARCSCRSTAAGPCTLFALSLGIGCFGAAVEIALNAGYVLGQAFGWTWGIDKKRRDASRFVAAFSVHASGGMAIATIGFDPLRVTLISVALTVVIMPRRRSAVSRAHERGGIRGPAHERRRSATVCSRRSRFWER